jgi:hypothetical protein
LPGDNQFEKARLGVALGTLSSDCRYLGASSAILSPDASLAGTIAPSNQLPAGALSVKRRKTEPGERLPQRRAVSVAQGRADLAQF